MRWAAMCKTPHTFPVGACCGDCLRIHKQGFRKTSASRCAARQSTGILKQTVLVEQRNLLPIGDHPEAVGSFRFW
jgi:hypothetical protein